ncbi:Amidase 1 [Cardamine amara subsp. amara]|uniref:Amidase 1 n=1 Tax=Cardamine amara subsp. amara TaxID=228776 RepID=A0ABD1A286_CARAN
MQKHDNNYSASGSVSNDDFWFEVGVAAIATDNDFGAFIEKLPIGSKPTSSFPSSLQDLTFAVKDIFDVEGRVTGFGNPDWLRTHSVATSTAPVVSSLLEAGATALGITIMDEMAYSINGENAHYGTPINPIAVDRVPGGSSSGSAVAVAARLVDFSIGTDTGGSVRVPSSYCGIFGFRPSHGAVSTAGVTPMAQSFDTVGWFARDTATLKRVGHVLLEQPNVYRIEPSQLIIADDCFELCSVPRDLMVQPLVRSLEKSFEGNTVIKKVNLGNYIEESVPSMKHFMTSDDVTTQQEFCIPSLMALSSSMRLLQRYEFKMNHGEWISSVKPEFGPGISARIQEAIETSDEKIDLCRSVKPQLLTALSTLLGGVLVIPTVPAPPPHLQADVASLESFRSRAFSLLSFSGFCQVSIPLGLATRKSSGIGFLLSLVDSLGIHLIHKS